MSVPWPCDPPPDPDHTDGAMMITSVPDQQDYALSLLENLHEIYNNAHLSDVTIIVGRRQFKAHRLMLSASSAYFRGMFSHDMLESRSTEIELKELSELGFQIMINFMYSGKMSLTMDNIHDALNTAAFLQVMKAVNQCVLFLNSELNFNNSSDILHLADLYELQSIKDHYRTLVLENFEEFSKTKEFLELDYTTLADYLQDDGLLTVKELHLLKIAEKWYLHDPKSRRRHAYEVFEKIRYTLDGWPAIEYMENIDVFSMSKRCRELTSTSIDVMHNPTRRHLCPSHQTRVRYKRKTLIQIGGVSDDFELLGCSTNSFYHHDLNAWLPAGCIGYFESHSHCVLVEVNDHGILCGGYLYEGITDLGGDAGGRMPTNEVKIIHPSGFSTWDMPYMNVPRVDFVVVHVSDYLVAVGGRNKECLLSSCERFDLQAETWTFVQELPQTLMQHAGSAYNDQVYVSGGVEGGQTVVSTLRVYDLTENTWLVKAPMITARSFHGQCTIGDQILVCGGWSHYRHRCPLSGATNGRCLNSVESYSPLTDQWTVVTPMRRSCASMAVVVFEGQMVVLGGEDYVGEVSDKVYAYDPVQSKWSHFCDLQIPLRNLACCALTINLRQALVTEGKFFSDDEEPSESEIEFVELSDLVEDLRQDLNDVVLEPGLLFE